MAIPGLGFLAFASRWFDAATVSRVFEPLIADWQREWVDASPSQRAWIRVRGAGAFVIAALSLTPRGMLLTATPPATTRRVLARIIIFTSGATVIMTAPFFSYVRELSWPRLVLAVLFLLPSSIVVVFPFAMTWVVDAIRRTAGPTPAERIAAVRTAVVAVAFVFVVIGWGMPAANQAFREVAAPEWARPPARGMRELSLSELSLGVPRGVLDGRDPHVIRRELNSRVVIAMLPAILLWLRWGAHNARRTRWFSPLPVPLETALAFVIFMSLHQWSVAIEPALGLRAGTGMWLALLALIAAGLLRNAVVRRLLLNADT